MAQPPSKKHCNNTGSRQGLHKAASDHLDRGISREQNRSATCARQRHDEPRAHNRFQYRNGTPLSIVLAPGPLSLSTLSAPKHTSEAIRHFHYRPGDQGLECPVKAGWLGNHLAVNPGGRHGRSEPQKCIPLGMASNSPSIYASEWENHYINRPPASTVDTSIAHLLIPPKRSLRFNHVSHLFIRPNHLPPNNPHPRILLHPPHTPRPSIHPIPH